MDRIRVSQVDNVLLQRGSQCDAGTLYIQQHHLVFRPLQQGGDEYKIPHALLALVTRQPSLLPLTHRPKPPPPQPSGEGSRPPSSAASRPARIYPLEIRLRTFESFSLGFESEASATDVFDSLKIIAILPSIDLVYAFFYQPNPPFSFTTGWSIYDFKAEMARQGVGSRTKAWRFTELNREYEFCPTYPTLLAVPTRISDATLQYAAKYRSKARIPALSYLHWANDASITRCAQPLPGLKQARSVQDEKVVEAIFSSHLYSQHGIDGGTGTAVYGATTTNVIVDARPRTNAMATYARGGGTENMDHYKGCRRDYLGIENIHVMRDSINRVVEALRAADEPKTFGMEVRVEAAVPAYDDGARQGLEGSASSSDMSRSASSASALRNHLVPGQRALDISALKRSNWLRHLSCLLEGTALITRNVHIASSHVMIHCSDGWDRTSQLSALAQVCLDPYFRTKRGFATLVEKEWLSFGHRFADRCGHGSSEKYFVTAAGHGESSDEEESDEGEGNFPAGAQAAANAFWGFTKQITSNFGGGGGGGSGNGSGGGAAGGQGANGHLAGPGAHVKETSPVFTQFLDCVWQIHRQYPTRFEFNDVWLSTMHRELYECRFGTFLANCERERKQAPLGSRRIIVNDTQSVWNYLLAQEHFDKFTNPRFDATLDDPKRADADMGVLLVKSNDVRWCPGLFGPRVEEANRAIEFEESERLRRKAEKARWDEERAAERARKEAEEKQRLAEQRAQLAAEAGLTAPTPQGSHVRTVSSSSGKGAVDLFTASQIRGQTAEDTANAANAVPSATREGEVDPTKLAYKARAPREARSSPAPVPPPGIATTSPPLPAQGGPDAATRFKSWAIGGWDRLQEAMAAPPPAPMTSSDHQQPYHNTWSHGAHDANPPSSHRSRPHMVVSDNPWSNGDINASPRSQLDAEPSTSFKAGSVAASQHYADSSIRSNPWRNAEAPRGSDTGVGAPSSSMRNARLGPIAHAEGLPNSLDDSMGRVALHPQEGDNSDASGSQRQQEAAQKEESKSAAFDPLGVGL